MAHCRRKVTLKGKVDSIVNIFQLFGDKAGGEEFRELINLINNPDDQLAAIEDFLDDIAEDSLASLDFSKETAPVPEDLVERILANLRLNN